MSWSCRCWYFLVRSIQNCRNAIGVYVQCLVEYHGWVMLVLMLMLMVDEGQHWFACAQQDSFLCMTTSFTHSRIHAFTHSRIHRVLWSFGRLGV